ncbi:MAG TPA: glycoside hydrolase family 5 protein, partial [Ktedonobacterales bacterium]|nr:glycoside hydrolase family 5 protein [Ktedonobacterales bacterium]
MARRSLVVVVAILIIIFALLVVSFINAQLPSRPSAPQSSKQKTPAPVPTATPRPSGLMVRGSRLFTISGQPVTLVGASHSSLEYSCKGDGHFQLADFQEMRAWGMNVVRIPLWSRYWLNPDDSCPTYQQTVEDAVANAEAAHLYVILDLQWSYTFPAPPYTDSAGNANYQFPMPDTGEAVQFWQQVATRYRNDQQVLFDLFGEPNDVSWQTWYSGGSVSTAVGTYQAIGMRGLVDVVRRIAPKNVIIVSGMNWGYDLSEVGSTYTFPETNLLFGTHPFDYGTKLPAYFDHAFGQTATKVAVIVTEFGSYDCATSYSAAVIAYANQHHLSWLAWTWAPYGCGAPSLLSNWSGAPSQPYGAYIKSQML